MFAMFGASVLVPFLFGINPAIVLFMNGVGTLLFMVITKGKAPAYLGSRFCFSGSGRHCYCHLGIFYALGGFVVVGLCGCILAGIVYKFGIEWIRRAAAGGDGPGGGADWSGTAGTAASTAGIISSSSYVLDEASGLYQQVVTPSFQKM